MAKKDEKSKVGRPKLADDKTKKDAYISVALSVAIMLVLSLSGTSTLTGRTPWQLLTFQNPNKISGNVAKAKDVKTTRNIDSEKTITRIIYPDGTVQKIIPSSKIGK